MIFMNQSSLRFIGPGSQRSHSIPCAKLDGSPHYNLIVAMMNGRVSYYAQLLDVTRITTCNTTRESLTFMRDARDAMKARS